MTTAICIVPLAPVRITPDHRVEMMSQLLFGETVGVLETLADGWIRVKDNWDGYAGCVRSNQLLFTEDAVSENYLYAANWVNEIFVNDKKMMVPFGSSLSFLNRPLPGVDIKYGGTVIDAATTVFNEKNIVLLANIFLNTTYIWGGRSVYGIDCSGFVQMVYRLMNYRLQRDANQQVNQGTVVGFLQEAVCGDLAFFDDEKGAIVHVGILLNDHQVIHSSGNVRIDPIDNEGIVNADTGLRTHSLRVIKRIV